jgi:hypothetical protein
MNSPGALMLGLIAPVHCDGPSLLKNEELSSKSG